MNMKPDAKSTQQVQEAARRLKMLNEPQMNDRRRIRALMNGGQGAIDVLLHGLQTNDHSLPAANHIKSGIERFSEMIAPAPDLRVDPPEHRDSDSARERAEKRERIVANYDRLCSLDAQLEQVSLWLVGYGFASWKICHAKDRLGQPYPKAELRDPLTTWVGEWGPDHKPTEMAYERWVTPDVLSAQYPHARPALEAILRSGRLPGGAVDLSTGGWDGQRGGIHTVEYVDGWGTYLFMDGMDDLLDAYEHPLNRPPVVVPRRITFDELKGQFTDVIGLAAVMAKLSLLTQIAMEDAVFAPVIVNGRMDQQFVKGRDAVNVIEGGDAKYLTQNVPYQMFQEIDRIQGQLRTNSGYSQQVDGESPMSFVTGAGLEELGSNISRQTTRNQGILRRNLTDKDAMQLEWDEKVYGGMRKALNDTDPGASGVERYDPKVDIAGHYGTRRIYGMMAGWDEPQKIVGGLQLLSANAIDLTTFRENLSGLDNIPRIEERQRKDRSEAVLFSYIEEAAAQQDPRALQAMLAVHKDGDIDKAIDLFYGEQEQAAQPALPTEPPGLQDAMAMMGGGGGEGTTLARLTEGGETQGGSQVVSPLGVS